MKVIHPTIQAHCHGFILETISKMKEEKYCNNEDTCGKKQECELHMIAILKASKYWNHFSYSQK